MTEESIATEYAVCEDVCSVFCDAAPEVPFVDEWGFEVHWCRSCYEEPCGRCFGAFKNDENKRKGLCQDCRDEIDSWGRDEERGIENDPTTEQTTLLTDGGEVSAGTERVVCDESNGRHDSKILKAGCFERHERRWRETSSLRCRVCGGKMVPETEVADGD